MVLKFANSAGSGGASEVEAEVKAGATIGKAGAFAEGRLVLGANKEDAVVGTVVVAALDAPNGRLNKLALPVLELPNKPVEEALGVLPNS